MNIYVFIISIILRKAIIIPRHAANTGHIFVLTFFVAIMIQMGKITVTTKVWLLADSNINIVSSCLSVQV